MIQSRESLLQPVVVLSGPANLDGGLSHDTQARIECGLRTAEKQLGAGSEPHLVLVGGQIDEMQSYIFDRGTDLAENNIYASGKYRETVGNALDAKPIIAELGASATQLTTANYHMPRSLWIFRRVIPGVLHNPNGVETPGYSGIELEVEEDAEINKARISRTLLCGYDPDSQYGDKILGWKLSVIASGRNLLEGRKKRKVNS